MLDYIQSICRDYRVDALYVFGSRTKEFANYAHGKGAIEKKSRADVDVGVIPARGHRLTARDRVRLVIDLEDLFGACRVDLVILPEASTFLALDVIEGELLYSADPDRTAGYELYVLRKAGDLAYFERQRRSQILSGAIL